MDRVGIVEQRVSTYPYKKLGVGSKMKRMEIVLAKRNLK
jgi:hypothetical protein